MPCATRLATISSPAVAMDAPCTIRRFWLVRLAGNKLKCRPQEKTREEAREKAAPCSRHPRLRRRVPRRPLRGPVPRAADQDDRAVGSGRRHRQHLPPACPRAAKASRPADRHRQCQRRVRHGRRARGEERASRRLHALRRPRLHPLDLLCRPQRRQILGLRADLHDRGDPLGAHRERQDAVEELGRARRGREAAAGQITVGATLASTSHIFPALLEKAAGIKFKYVSYDGLAPRMNALLGGHIDLTDSNLTQKGKVDAGLLRFLAIASEKRDPEIPDVPTLKELGFNVVYEVVRGLLVPKGTPAPVKGKLEEACTRAAKEPGFAQAMKLQGTRVAFLDAKEYAAFLDKIDAENKTIMADLGLMKK